LLGRLAAGQARSVVLLIGYHAWNWRLVQDFAADRNVRSAGWYRGFNEVPSLLLIGIVLLAVARPF
jgi:putative membrane protein